MGFRIAVATALLVAVALPTAAQQPVTLQFNAGRVTLQARNAPVRTILAEWARLGGATVVNGERVAGAPVTLELTDVTERQALDIILRGVAGYMLAPRRAGSVGTSAFDRIMILPTSVAPQNPPPPAAAGLRPAVPRPPMIVRPPQPTLGASPDPEPEEEPADPEPTVDAPPVNNPRMMPPVIRPLPGSAPNPNDDADAEAPESSTPATTAAPTTPSNPFGVPAGSSTTPGTIAPVPTPRPQRPPPANRVQ